MPRVDDENTAQGAVLADYLKKKGYQRPTERGPVWAGPCGDGPQGGVTQSLLGRWLSCRERFRILVIEGLKTAERFTPTLDFGNLWHAAEEALAAQTASNPLSNWSTALDALARGYFVRYPMQREEVGHWHAVAKNLFPHYVEYWRRHPDTVQRTPIMQETKFDEPYRLPSGRVVRLRGKWDAVDYIDQAPKGVYVQENKTKSSIDPGKVSRQMRFNLQTNFYLIALHEHRKRDGIPPLLTRDVQGIRYNVVRRPAHKSIESMLDKMALDCRNGRAGEWFARWKVESSLADLSRFKRECLVPALENLCDDYEWWSWCKWEGTDIPLLASKVCSVRGRNLWDSDQRHERFPHHHSRHYRFPYSVYDPMKEGGFGEVDSYMETGSEAGLQRVTDLFPELAERKVA